LNSGNALAISIGLLTKWLTKNQRPSILLYYFLAKHLGTLARKENVMTFQVLNLKRKQFLDLFDDDNNIIEPSYTKGGSWLKVFGHSNSLCVCASRAITNYALTSKYRLRFFSREEFKCLCKLYPIESRHHILHKCDRFNGY